MTVHLILSFAGGNLEKMFPRQRPSLTISVFPLIRRLSAPSFCNSASGKRLQHRLPSRSHNTTSRLSGLRYGLLNNQTLQTTGRWIPQSIKLSASFHCTPVAKQQQVTPFLLADIGEGITECELIQWFIKEGDQIQQFDKICEVQSDKATVEITSRFDGVAVKLHYKPGDVAKVGQPLIDISSAVGSAASTVPVSSVPPAEETQAAATAAPSTPSPGKPQSSQSPQSPSASGSGTMATPAVRRIAKENNVDLSKVQATGKGGRITKEDILSFINVDVGGKSPLAAAAAVAAAATAPDQSKVVPTSAVSATPQTIQLTPVQKAMVKSMKKSLAIPHFGFADDISFDHLRQVRSGINQFLGAALTDNDKEGQVKKISFMPLLLKSFSVALDKYPLLNAQFIDGSATGSGKDHLLYRSVHNIGVAVDSPNGLVVPNVQRVNEKSILEIAHDLERLRRLASRGQLPPESFQGTTITISNIGNLGGRNLHPVIPPDTVCIVAIGKSQVLPRYDPQTMELRPDELATVSFSADHRVVDGATVARFFAEWKQLLETPGRLLMTMK